MSESTEFLILRLESPLQSWGTVAVDPVRPTSGFPTRSALAGLIASALGWRYRDGAKTTALQDHLRMAVREERRGNLTRDFQTADLGAVGQEGWTRWGVEKRGGSAARDTHLLEKWYLAGAAFTAAITLTRGAPAELHQVQEALQRPARPLFLGRKSCLPASPLLAGRIEAESPFDALQRWPLLGGHAPSGDDPIRLRCWYGEGEGPPEGEPREVWDRRDFVSDRFAGSRWIRTGYVEPPLRATGGESGHEK